MKKALFVLSAIAFGGLFFNSCGEPIDSKIAVSNGMDDYGNHCIIVSVPKDSTANYINVYRAQITEKTETGEDGKDVTTVTQEQTYNIGQINSNPKDGMISYSFKDSNIVAGAKYIYSARYIYNNRTVSNGWSVPVKAEDDQGVHDGKCVAPFLKDETHNFEPRLVVSEEEGNETIFTYKPKAWTIEVTGGPTSVPVAVKDAISNPVFPLTDTEAEEKKEPVPAYYLSIAVKNSEKARVFRIKDDLLMCGKSFETYTDGGKQYSKDTIDLRSVLSEDFFRTPVRILGFLYEWEEKPSDGNYSIYHWTIPATNMTNTKPDECGGYIGSWFRIKCEEEDADLIVIDYDYHEDSSHDYGSRGLVYGE